MSVCIRKFQPIVLKSGEHAKLVNLLWMVRSFSFQIKLWNPILAVHTARTGTFRPCSVLDISAVRVARVLKLVYIDGIWSSRQNETNFLKIGPELWSSGPNNRKKSKPRKSRFSEHFRARFFFRKSLVSPLFNSQWNFFFKYQILQRSHLHNEFSISTQSGHFDFSGNDSIDSIIIRVLRLRWYWKSIM